jgi:hypothetical protein
MPQFCAVYIGIGLIMPLNMSTSDQITLLMGFAQIAVAIALGVWTVHRTALPHPIDHEANSKRSMKRHLFAWLSSSWLFLVFFVYGSFELWSLLASEEALSKAFVFKLVFFAFYTAFNCIAAVGFFLFELQMTINGVVLDFLQKSNEVQIRTNEVQRNIVDVQRESLSLTQRAVEIHRPRRRPKK